MMRRILLLIAATQLAAPPAQSWAQAPPPVVAQYKTRFLAIGNLAMVEWTKSTTIGVLYQHSLRKSSVERLPQGSTVEHNPRWYAHALATGGVSYHDGVEWAGFLQLGLARRNESATFTATAVAAQYVDSPRGLGPVARVELMDNFGFQVGWVFLKDGGGATFISLDYMRNILKDLGLD